MKKNKFIFSILLTSFFIFLGEQFTHAQIANPNLKTQDKKTNLNKSKKSSQVTKSKNYVQKPKLKPDENAVFFEHEYRIFKTKNVEGIDYSLNCFKNKTPNCKAYLAVKEDTRWSTQQEGDESNLAAKLCRQHQGRALIAINSKNEEFDICRFIDGSIYSSWQVYYKLNNAKIKQ